MHKNFIEHTTFAPAPGDQLLQNLPRAETQQGYVVVAVCLALFLFFDGNAVQADGPQKFSWKIFAAHLLEYCLQDRPTITSLS